MSRSKVEIIIRREALAAGFNTDLIEVLDGMAAERGFEATEGGHLVALLEEEADWQLTIYNSPKAKDGVNELDEKIDALKYAVTCLEICKTLIGAGYRPVYPAVTA